MHDYFHILGVSDAAPADELRRALRRRPGRTHPDFRDGDTAGPCVDFRAATARTLADAAIDFVDMRPIVERMQVAFFQSSS